MPSITPTPRRCENCPSINEFERRYHTLDARAERMSELALKSTDPEMMNQLKDMVREESREDSVDEVAGQVHDAFVKMSMEHLNLLDDARKELDDRKKEFIDACPEGVLSLVGRDAFGYTVVALLCGSGKIERESGMEPAIVNRDADYRDSKPLIPDDPSGL